MAGKTGSAKSQPATASSNAASANNITSGGSAAQNRNARASANIRNTPETVDTSNSQQHGTGTAEQQQSSEPNKIDDATASDAAASASTNDDINNRNKETYIAYLEEHNIVDMLVKALQLLYAEPENPDRVVEYLKTTIWGEEYLARVANRQSLEQDLKNLRTELRDAESQLQKTCAEAEALGISTAVELEYLPLAADGAEIAKPSIEPPPAQVASPLLNKPGAAAALRQSVGQKAAALQESTATAIPPGDVPTPDEDQNDSDQWSWSGEEDSDSEFDYFDGVWDALLHPNGIKDDALLLNKDLNVADEDIVNAANEK